MTAFSARKHGFYLFLRGFPVTPLAFMYHIIGAPTVKTEHALESSERPANHIQHKLAAQTVSSVSL